MSPTAAVIFAGVGAMSLAAYSFPVTWSEVVYVPAELAVRMKPVSACRPMGLTPTSPVYRGRHGAHTALGDNGKVCGGAEVDSARALGTVQDQTAATLGLSRVGQESCNHEANGECVLMETRHDLRERIGRVSRGNRDCTSHRQRGNSAGSGELIMSLFAKFTRFCLITTSTKECSQCGDAVI